MSFESTAPAHDRMSTRAKVQLILVSFFARALFGLVLIFDHASFDSDAYSTLKLLFPLTTWGIIFIVVGSVALIAALTESAALARVALVLSVSLTAAWASGFISAALVEEDVRNPTVLYLSLCVLLADLVLCSQPLRTPFEAVKQKFIH
jgi:di/tricarboxylate transporter